MSRGLCVWKCRGVVVGLAGAQDAAELCAQIAVACRPPPICPLARCGTPPAPLQHFHLHLKQRHTSSACQLTHHQHQPLPLFTLPLTPLPPPAPPCSAYLNQWHISTTMSAIFDNDTVALPGMAKFCKTNAGRAKADALQVGRVGRRHARMPLDGSQAGCPSRTGRGIWVRRPTRPSHSVCCVRLHLPS